MRLQNKVFGFSLQSGDNPVSKLLTSKLRVNKKESDILVSELFYGVKKEKNGQIKGFSILEFLDENGNISINDKIYNLSFSGNEEIFFLKSVTDPKDYVLDDKELSENILKEIETKIESSAPIEEPTQPQVIQTEEEIQPVVAEPSIYENEEYEQEKADLKKEGFIEFNTNPKSNLRALVRHNDGKKEKIVLIEISENDYEVLKLDDYLLDFNNKTKTFEYEKKGD